MKLGVCYYPEHWPEHTWQPDAKRMKDTGIHWVRIGEFAWSKLEPRDGQLEFDWLDRAIDTLGQAGLKVVLGTHTATPPKWLIDKYDDVLQVGADGHVRKFGSRRHYCFNSASYLSETKRIVRLLAERYGKHEAVAAWQTDNEYGCHDTVRCYCPNCVQAFQTWLEARYGTVEALNDAWWNVFWSMEYTSFDEVELPNQTVTEANPAHALDYYRFASDSVIAYNKLQTNLIKQHSAYPVTHNVMLFFDAFDHFKLADDLDIVTWDNYPLGMLEWSPLPDDVKAHFLRAGHPDLVSFHHDLYYGLKRKPFWVMEQQPGQVNWAPSNPIPAPNVVRLWSHQAFAHGADVVSYFRWRAAVGAQELMHAGLNLFDGTPDRATHEAKQVHEEIKHQPGGVASDAEVALLYDYENLWATNLQPHAQGWHYSMLVMHWYSALRELGLNVAIRRTHDDLSRYNVVFAPALHLVDDKLAVHLTHYVQAGGQLVIGPRSGFKTLTNQAQAPAPGPLKALMGVTITHVDALRPGITESVTCNGETLTYSTWADLLTPAADTRVVGTYNTAAYAQVAAVTQKQTGAGTTTTIGMWTDAENLKPIIMPILKTAGVRLQAVPFGVRVTRRGEDVFVLNFNPHVTQLSEDLGGGELDAYDVRLPHTK